ncbi:DoxX family protein [Paracoccus aminophilus]|uniref:DoxX family protein n=1 Tax=Paracoccus aminophilus JCM 7686 TaxID=1367847 RepID=S5YU77_PARAH|nr:DoxX family protein [Paracoccus aminophilus]AGT08796.1 hypothetical protein JCM7686_1695 [Paracoccus aminophilus JCM 7686]
MIDTMLPLITHPHAVMTGKALLTSFFWLAGLFGLFNFKTIVQEMVDVGLPRPRLFALATIACQLLGSALLISNVAGLAWLGAGALAVFTLLCIPIGHPFWKFSEPKRSAEFHIALEHIAVVGGLFLAAAISQLY